MKTIIAALILALSSIGCLSADLTVNQLVVQHDFTSPNDIPGCSPSLEVYFPCPTGPVTVNLPGFSENIHFQPPGGVTGKATIDHILVDTTNPDGFGFIQNVTMEVSAPGIATYPLVDYVPSVTPGQELYLAGDDVDLMPYIEAPMTEFVIAISGTVPTAEVPLHVTIFINAEVSYEKSL